ncbi:MAG: glycosyltransferase [Eubacterium sp.]|nr:glycosyltransferase [Eubacterium sp.]
MESQTSDKRINVLVLITAMDRAGAETMMMNYLRHIDRNKVHMDFVVNREYESDYEKEIKELGSKVYHLSPIYPNTVREYKKEFKKFLKEHPNYDVIHSNLEERSAYPLAIAKKAGIDLRIVHAHSNLKHVDIKYIFRLYLRKKLRGKYTHSFACSRGTAKWLFGDDKKTIIVRNAIDTGEFKYDENLRKKAREELRIEDDTILIGHVGRFSYEKNHKYLLRTFAEVNKMKPNSRLVLIGGGKNRSELRLKDEIIKTIEELNLQDKVIMLGVRDDMPYIMQAIDIFALPSLSEGFPLTLMEAQSLGLKCIVSDNVPKECNVTGEVKYLSANTPPDEAAWELLLLKDKKVDPIEMNRKVKAAGYDIKTNAMWLERVYSKAILNEQEENKVLKTNDRRMKLMKAWYHFKARIKKLVYKIIYGRRLRIGKGTTWRHGFHITIEGGQVEIGKDCFFNNYCSINSLKKVTIGDGTIFGSNCHIYDHNHRFSDIETSIKAQGYTLGETHIGKHCWFGTNAVVLKGVTIGDNCVIGAGVVVSEDVPEGTVISK